jgi:hypothetical protein
MAQGIVDHTEGATLVVTAQVFHILEQEGFRATMSEDPLDVEEQRALLVAVKTVRPPERVLLGDACQRERLAREACKQHVVLGYIFHLHITDVFRKRMVRRVAEILQIGLPAVLVALAGENAFTAYGLEAQSHAADPGKEVDKPERLRA